jgi:hypothetical protein
MEPPMTPDPTRDLPDAAMLVAEARQTLLEHILPALNGDARIKALMVANALGIAARDLAAPPPPDLAGRVPAIRAGAHDADPALHAALLDAARQRVTVSRPAALGGCGD